jgi:hypothetical protein
MTVLDWTVLLLGAIWYAYAGGPFWIIMVATIAVILVLRLLMGERYPKLGNRP